jgi:hypothetical protein
MIEVFPGECLELRWDSFQKCEADSQWLDELSGLVDAQLEGPPNVLIDPSFCSDGPVAMRNVQLEHTDSSYGR